jgi:hypothetical protein
VILFKCQSAQSAFRLHAPRKPGRAGAGFVSHDLPKVLQLPLAHGEIQRRPQAFDGGRINACQDQRLAAVPGIKCRLEFAAHLGCGHHGLACHELQLMLLGSVTPTDPSLPLRVTITYSRPSGTSVTAFGFG